MTNSPEEGAFMTLTADALWLNSFFAGFDTAILSLFHKLAELAGSVLTPVNRVITFLGEKGLVFILLALVLLLFPRWRRSGVCILFSLCFSVIFCTFIVKRMVARPRPFEALDTVRQWWQFIGAPGESGFSFPSGHVTAAAAGAASLCLTRGKRWLIPGVVWVLLMMCSRVYLMAHYPSDVLFALFLGVFCAFLAYAVTQLIYRFLEAKSGEVYACDFLLEAGPESLSDLGSLRNRSSSTSVEAKQPAEYVKPEKTSHRAVKVSTHSKKARSSSSEGTYQGKH